MLALPAMDPAHALADLTEVSTQLEGAVLADGDGKVLASTFADEAKGDRIARAALALLDAAEKTRMGGEGAELAQVLARTPAGSAFLVRDGRRLVTAVTGPDPTVGLIFYDLKTCLRLAADEAAASGTKEEPAPAESADA